MFEKIKTNVSKLKESIKDKDVTIVCASKYISVEVMRYLYSLGITHFGESRADELLKESSTERLKYHLAFYWLLTIK